MRTLQEWYTAYGESHQHKTNKKIHYICVPSIYFAIIGLLMAIPNQWLIPVFKTNSLYISNWANVLLLFLFAFYYRLSKKTMLRIAVLSIVSVALNVFISAYFSLLYFNLTLFILAWIGQFYGHHLEGKKPSFFEDLQFLLIGPAWVLDHFFNSDTFTANDSI